MTLTVCAQNSYLSEKRDTFNKKKWKQLTKNVDYTDNIEKKAPQEIKSFNLPKPKKWPTVLQYGVILTVIVLLLFLVIRLFLQRNSINRKLKRDDLLIEDVKKEEKQQGFLYEKLLEKIQKEDYKEAVRYYFLWLIIHLVNNKWIVWKKDKTNNDYLREMRNKTDYYNTFSELTIVFEKVIYGNTPVTKRSFDTIQKKFDAFITSLN
jgi:hypothetical protein